METLLSNMRHIRSLAIKMEKEEEQRNKNRRESNMIDAYYEIYSHKQEGDSFERYVDDFEADLPEHGEFQAEKDLDDRDRAESTRQVNLV